ncbi:MAG: hypothetical protein J5787_09980 [Alphaproteobacteria bacterium]|nr:hypothetical protein [Alphaproteobacteria bacterium]MBO4644347.1 hypothetical protein [Alphaproteobacteria bacterium]
MKKLFLCGALCLLSACSSIINGTSQEISFKGNVNGIKIKQNGTVLCSVPCTVLIDRTKNGTVLTAEKEGYKTEEFSLRTKLSSLFWLNVTSLDPFASTTDATVGGMWVYSPSEYYVDLIEIGGTADTKVQEVKKFVLKNYAALKAEAAKGKSGEYLDSLEKLTGIGAQNLKEDISKCSDAATCANMIADKI